MAEQNNTATAEAPALPVPRTNPITGQPMKPSVGEAWTAVMNEVQKVSKDQTAESGTNRAFKFRGVDAVVDAVGPALRKHGVTIHPKKIKKITTTEYETSRGTRMINREVTVKWQVRGPNGDTFEGESVGEAADSGDKSMSKAQSVAYRVYLLQSLCIPTGDPDPDMNVHERASRAEGDNPALQAEMDAANEARGELLARTSEFGWNEETLVRECWERLHKNLRNTRDLNLIKSFGDTLVEEAFAGRSPLDKARAARQQLEGDVVATAQQADAAEQAQRSEPITDGQLKKLNTLLSKEKISSHDERVAWCSQAVNREVDSTKKLTKAEAKVCIEELERPIAPPPEKGTQDDNTNQ